jgi:hypothetical protein
MNGLHFGLSLDYLLLCQIAKFRTMAKSLMTIKCTSFAGCFDGHDGPLVQYKEHCPMQQVQGYTGGHWMPPLGNYLLRIAPVATRATGKLTMMNKYTYFAGRFDGHCDVPVHNCAHCLMEAVQGFTRSHLMPPADKYNV